MRKINVGLIYGGNSCEHEVSKMTAQSVLENIDRDIFNVREIFLSKKSKLEPWSLKDIDIAFLAVHGPNCEDGKMQKILESNSVRYTGSKVEASILNMDKIKMHDAFKTAGLPVVEYLPFDKFDSDSQIIEQTETKIGYPCFVKPNNTGSSIGVSKVKNIHELRQAILRAFKFDEKIIIEKCVPDATDVEIGVLGNAELVVSDPGMIAYNEDFYTYEAKYSNAETTIEFDCLDEAISKEIKKMAKIAFLATGCSGYARIDFLVSKTGEIFINEINTLPGFTKTSMYPKLMAKKGIGYTDLITHIINLALPENFGRAIDKK